MNYFKQRFRMNGIGMTIILSIFYFLLLKYTSYLFIPVSDLQTIAIVLFLAFINVISVYFELKHSNIISRTLMFFSESIKWASIMYGFLALAVFLFKGIICPIPTEYAKFLLLIIVLLYIYGIYNARHVKINEKNLYLKNLTEEMTIVHISDIHVGSLIRDSLMRKTVEKINEVNPDIVIISGDLADGTCAIGPNHFDVFKESNSPIIFTPGNHDDYPDLDCVINAAENAGITVLNNKSMEFKGLNIYGLPFSFYHSSQCNFNLDKNETNLLIYHVPMNWDEFIEMGFDIQLSGHTHGGQFYPATYFIRRMFPYSRGLFEKNGNYLNVTDGIGTFGPPIRVGTHCDMSVLKLKRKS